MDKKFICTIVDINRTTITYGFESVDDRSVKKNITEPIVSREFKYKEGQIYTFNDD